MKILHLYRPYLSIDTNLPRFSLSLSLSLSLYIYTFLSLSLSCSIFTYLSALFVCICVSLWCVYVYVYVYVCIGERQQPAYEARTHTVWSSDVPTKCSCTKRTQVLDVCICMCVYMCVCMYVCICVYACICASLSSFACALTCIRMQTNTQTNTLTLAIML